MNGLQLAAQIRAHLHRQIPVIILTGDISTETMREIARQDCVQLNKPVKLNELTQTIRATAFGVAIGSRACPIRALLNRSRVRARPSSIVVDDDDRLRETVRSVLEDAGRTVEDFANAEAFLAGYRPGGDACASDRCQSAGNERARTAAAAALRRPSAAGNHDHRRWRRADGRSGHEGRRQRLHREADRS